MDGFSRCARLFSLFRLRPFEIATSAGRSQERYRRAVLTAVSAGIAKAIGALTLLVSVPMTLSYLGAERYGLWMTIGSVVTILGFSDLGIANGLVNAISEANGKDDPDLARRYISSAFFMLVTVAIILLATFAGVYAWIPWHRLFNVHSAVAVAEAGPAMAIFFVCFVVNIPLSVINRVQVGYQQGFTNNLWGAIGSILALGAVILACHRRAGLPWLVLSMTGTPVLATLLNGAVLFGAARPWLRPSLRYCDRAAVRIISRIGMMFCVLQIAVAFGFSSDNIVVAQMLGPAAVTQYAVPSRMFSVVTMLLATAMTPLWPAYGEALARREFHWVRKTLKRSIVLGMAIAVPTYAVLFLFANRLLHLWVGSEVVSTPLLLAGFAVWGILTTIGYSIGAFLNAAGAIKIQALMATLMAFANLVLSIVLTRSLGVSGPVWGSVVSFSFVTLIPLAVFLPRLLQSLSAPGIHCSPQPQSPS